MSGKSQRVIACLFPDWPATALLLDTERDLSTPVVIVDNYQVTAANARARQYGIQVGMRQRDAHSRCPEALLAAHNDDRDARWFEPVIQRCDTITPHMEVLRPGLIVVSSRSVASFYGGEEAACEVLATEMEQAGVECLVGSADSMEAAVWAAPRSVLVTAGQTSHFLHNLPIHVLAEESALPFFSQRCHMAAMLARMGVQTMGQFAHLPRPDVVQRFGNDARDIHCMACGEPLRAVLPHPAEVNSTVQHTCEPPLCRIDEAAFLARRLAVQLHERLVAQDLCCHTVEVGACTTDGVELVRTWRCSEPLSSTAMADRMRWQLEGWLTSGTLTAGLQQLWMRPLDVVGAGHQQPDLWSGVSDREMTRRRCLTRVQGMLGENDVLSAVPSGGWGPNDAVSWVPYGDAPTVRQQQRAAAPWEGKMLCPLPATIVQRPVTLLDSSRHSVGVTGRGVMTAAPAYLEDQGCLFAITNWAGPWTFDDKWWEDEPVRCARIQVQTSRNELFLLVIREKRWYIEGEY